MEDRPALLLLASGGATPVRRAFEELTDASSLGRWLAANITAPMAVTATDDDLEAITALREALFRTVRRRTADEPDLPEDLRVINDCAKGSPLSPAIDVATGGLAWQTEPTAAAALATTARDAIDLLTGPLGHRVRECANPHCEIVFVDTSPPGARRWCAMGRCGNQQKNRTYRSRKTAEGTARL